MESPKLQLLFKGFTQAKGFRVFQFEGVAADRSRTGYTVRTDLALIQRYGIRLQDLPLLCRAVLERGFEGEERHDFTYTEADMGRHASVVAARDEASHKKKAPRRPVSDQVGAAWRVPQR